MAVIIIQVNNNLKTWPENIVVKIERRKMK